MVLLLFGSVVYLSRFLWVLLKSLRKRVLTRVCVSVCLSQSSGAAVENDPLGALPSGWGKSSFTLYLQVRCLQ